MKPGMNLLYCIKPSPQMVRLMTGPELIMQIFRRSTNCMDEEFLSVRRSGIFYFILLWASSIHYECTALYTDVPLCLTKTTSNMPSMLRQTLEHGSVIE